MPSPIRFLDLCCGNGGDIGKVAHQNVTHYFGIDIASDAVKRACERLNASPLEGDVIEFNAFTSTCGNMLFHMKKFDVVSCQFAIHYAFGSETTARLFIQNVAFALRNGGRFIGTLPDEQHLRVARQHLGKRFGDQFHSIRFNDTTSTFEDFGSSYQFSFKGAVNDLEEFIVKPSVLERLCADCGMKSSNGNVTTSQKKNHHKTHSGTVWAAPSNQSVTYTPHSILSWMTRTKTTQSEKKSERTISYKNGP